MASAPNIPVFEIFEDRNPEHLGVLFRPQEVYAMATAISVVEARFLAREDDPDLQGIVKKYADAFVNAPAEESSDQIFAWYWHYCSQAGAIVGDSTFKASPKDFTPGARRFLAIQLLDGLLINSKRAHNLYLLLEIFDVLLEMEEKEFEKWDKRTTGFLRMAAFRALKAVFYIPICFMLRNKPYMRKFDFETCQTARAAIQKLMNYYQMAANEGRVFTFDQPSDNIAETLDLGDMRISKTQDGRIVFES